MKDLLILEQHGWEALASGSEAANLFYEKLLREDAVMIFPGGMRIVGRQQILQSLDDQPWDSYEIHETKVVDIDANTKTLVYRVAARREGSPLYEALISSTYVFTNDTWKLVLHQHSRL